MSHVTPVVGTAIALLISAHHAPAQAVDDVWSGWLREFLDGDAEGAREVYARAAPAAATPGTLLALSRLLELSRVRNDEAELVRWTAAVPTKSQVAIAERLRERLPAEDLDLVTDDADRAARRARWIELANSDWTYCASWSNTTWPLFRWAAPDQPAQTDANSHALRLKLNLPPRAPIAIRRRAAQLADLRLGGQLHGADRLEFDLVQRLRDLPRQRSHLAEADAELPVVTDASLAKLERMSHSPSLSKLEAETLRRAHSRCVDLHASGETDAARRLLGSLPYRFR